MKVLVTGGAGYIGSFMTKRLLDDGHEVVVADSFEKGHRAAVDVRALVVDGNLLDKNLVSKLFSDYRFDTVMHFASYIAVGESMQDPGLYLQNNIFSTFLLLEEMRKHGVDKFIFSSTGTVYGIPQHSPMDESHAKNPENPYSESKLIVERILHWYFQIHQVGFAVLRYFNAAGAAFDGSMGEDHTPETHIIPNAMKAALTRSEFSLFGDDYDTPDGTGIRDYIHVLDLIEAHISTLKKLQEENGEYIYNVGTGKGCSNREVLDMVKKASGVDFPVVVKSRREGDVAATVADTTKIKNELGFEPKYSDLETMITTAWKWHSTHPQGYEQNG